MKKNLHFKQYITFTEMMGQSAFGEIAVTVNRDPDVQHSSEQLELSFLYPDSTVETVLVPLSPLIVTCVISPPTAH